MSVTDADRRGSQFQAKSPFNVAVRRAADRSRRGYGVVNRAICETVESRTLLAAAIKTQVPASITPSTVAQTVLSPGVNSFTLTSSSTSAAASNKIRFVLNNADAAQTTTFQTRLTSGVAGSDAAIALYDDSGNRLFLQDLDPSGITSSEKLTTTLKSGVQYEVEFFGLQTATGTSQLGLVVDTGPQTSGTTLTSSPATGVGSLSTANAPDAFTSSSNTRYIPISLPNAGSGASISIAGGAQDSAVMASLFVSNGANSWTKLSSATLNAGGSPVSLSVTPPGSPGGVNVTDGQYLLALAPLNYSAAPEPVTITASASSLLAPSAISATLVSGTITQTLDGSGSLIGSNAGSFAAGATGLVSVTAATSGPMTITFQPTTYYIGVLSVYGPAETNLITTRSGSSPQSPVTTTINAVAGQTYFVRAAVNGGSQAGSFSISASQAYTPTNVDVTATLAQQAALAISPASGSQVFHMTPVAGSRFFAIQLAPDGSSSVRPQVTILDASGTPTTYTAPAGGQPVTVVLDQSLSAGPYDVQVSGVSGTGTATLKYVVVNLPASIAVGQFSQSILTNSTGSLASNVFSTTTGTPTGIQYFQPNNGSNAANTTYSAVSGNGGAAILVHYVQEGNTFKFVEAIAPGGSTTASVSEQARGQTLHALVALPINFSGAGNVQLTVAGPLPVGISVPFTPNVVPGAAQPPQGFQSTLNVSGVSLATNIERDLYSAQIPFNLTGSTSSLTFTPNDIGGPLRVTLSVLNASNVIIATGTSNAGQALTVPISGLTAGQVIRFEVKAVNASNVGTGGYSLGMAVNTTDSRPYLVTESQFYPYASPQVSGRNYLPSGIKPKTVTFNGAAVTDSFTTSAPYNDANGTPAGALQMFKLTGAPSNQPYQVTATDVDTGVNVNFALYKFDSTTNSYTLLNGTGPSFDYYPGDRSTLDARVVVNNTDLDPIYSNAEIGGGPIDLYAVVKNEQGTQGNYSIKFESAPTNAAVSTGSALPVLPNSGSQYVANGGLVLQPGYKSQYTLRTPSDMSTGAPTLTVKTNDGSSGQTVTVSVGRGFVVVGTYSGTVGAGGVANIVLSGGIQNISKNGTYDVTIVFGGTYPASGAYVGISAPRVAAPSNAPANLPTSVPQQNSYNSTYTRLNVAPNGVINQLQAASLGVTSTVFNVENPGLVTLHVAYPAGSTNVSLGLYASGQTFTNSNGPFTSAGLLLDYTVTADAQGLYTITAALQKGTYFLRGTGTIPSGSFTIVTVTGTMPAVPTQTLTVEPGTGITAAAEETILNQGQFASTSPNNNPFFSSRYRSATYAVTAPANANGQPLTFSIFDSADNVSTGAGVGIANVTIYRLDPGNVYTKLTTKFSALTASLHGSTISSGDTVVPGAKYFITVEFNAFQVPAYVGVNIPIFTTGIADFSVNPVTLAANSGSTLVSSGIVNGSFTASAPSNYTLKLGSTTSTRAVPALAPFGRLGIFIPWTPTSVADTVSVTANPNAVIPELSNSNNTQMVALSNYDSAAPDAQISLADSLMTSEGSAAASHGGGTWGRYIAGVTGQSTTIRVAATDGNNDLYSINAKIQNANGTFALDNLKVFYSLGTGSFTQPIPFDFGTLGGTNTTNLNKLNFYATDIWGIRTPIYVQSIDVAAPPKFLTGGVPAANVQGAGGTITFSAATHQFTYNFQDSIINLDKSLSDLLGVDVPVIGDKENKLLISITGTGTGTLNPNTDVPLSLTGHALLTAMDHNIYDKTYSGTGQIGNNVTFKSLMTLNGHSLVPGSASVSLQLTNLQLIDTESPEIPIFSLGIPDVAEVTAGIKFGLNAKLNGAVKVGLDPTAGSIGGYLGSLGVMSPTYIQPVITGTATVSGHVSVFGFDVASLSGSVGLTLTVTLGLDNSVGNAIIPFDQAPGDLALAVDATLKVHLAAHVAILGDIYTYDYNHDYGNIVNTIHHGIFLTDPPVNAPGKFIGPSSSLRGGSDADPDPVIKTGSSMVGGYSIEPSPQLVINNSVVNGMGLSVQLVNAGTVASPVANLAFSNRVGGVWSSLQNLTGSNDVADPQLALSHDGSGTPGVVVYDADNLAGSPATQTLNQRLTSQDIRYRYFNGTTWSAEQSLTNDSLYDSQQTVAFNATGAGALAFVHNTNATPMGASGLDSSSNEIYGSVWNAATHTWGTPVAITSGGASDTSPSAYVDASGNRYIVWIRNSGGTSQMMYSTNSGSGWSAPAVLSAGGLQAGGTFQQIAIGSDGAGRVDTVFSYVIKNADGSLSTTLYHRPALTSNFATNLPAVQITNNATYSGLKVTNTPTGSLVAYWQMSDGQDDQIMETTISGGTSTTPVQVTNSVDVPKSPSVAVDGDGKLQLLYNNSISYGGTSNGATTDPSVGAPLAAGVSSSSAQMLPQFSFSNGLHFPTESQTPTVGSSLTGTSTIVNKGLAAGTVTIAAYNGTPTSGTAIASKTVTLQPGGSYDFSQAFTVGAGLQNYSIGLTSSSGQAFGSTGNVSTVQLTGLGDVAAVSLTNDVGSPSPGSTQLLYATVQNLSNVTSGPVTVTIYQGDPRSPQLPSTAISTQTITLNGSASQTLLFNVTLPAGAGDDIFTVVVDPANAIAEGNENNNDARYEVDFRTDPAILNPLAPPVTATLLNSGTSNNVEVDASVRNQGALDLTNVPVNLRVSRNGGAYTDLGQFIIPSLPAGQTVTATFTVTGLAGDNVYLVSIDPSVNPTDLDLSNNSGTATLTIAGTATLVASATLSKSTSVAGSALSVTANIVNNGLADAANIPLIVTATPQGGGASYIIGTATLSVGGLSSGTVTFNVDTSVLARGIYTFTLQVDPNDVVLKDASVNDITLTEVISTPLVLTNAAEYVRLDADGTHLDVWDASIASGSPTQQYLLSTISSISTATSAVSNLMVDFANGSPIPVGGFVYNATGSASNLSVIGTTTVDSFNLSPVLVNFVHGSSSGSISYGNLGSLTLIGGGGADQITLNSSSGNPLPANLHLSGTFTLGGFTSFAGTTVDIGKSTVFISYTPGNDPVAAIRQYLTRGFAGGAWNGTATPSLGSINSTSGAALGTSNSIGYADSADGRGINTTPNTIELKYTVKGDANLDGTVNFNDLVILAQNYNATGKVYDQGDYDFDGNVAFSDLVILAQSYGASVASLLAAIEGTAPGKKPHKIDPGNFTDGASIATAVIG